MRELGNVPRYRSMAACAWPVNIRNGRVVAIAAPGLEAVSVAPLRLAGIAVAVPIHLRIRTVADEVPGFGTGGHLRAHRAPVAGIARGRRHESLRLIRDKDLRRRYGL